MDRRAAFVEKVEQRKKNREVHTALVQHILDTRRAQLAEERRLKQEAEEEAERIRLERVEAERVAREAAENQKEVKAHALRREAARKANAEEALRHQQKMEAKEAAKKAEMEALIERLKKEALESHYAELKAKDAVLEHPNWRLLTVRARQFLQQSSEHKQDLLKRMDSEHFLIDTEKAARGQNSE